jgi:hypothetical protein
MDAYRIEDSIEHATITLGNGDYARIEDGRGATVTVAYGSAWLTQANDTEDVCLRAGDSFRIRRNGATLVSAFKPTMLIVTPFTPEPRPMQVGVAVRGMEPVELFETGAPKRSIGDRFNRFWCSLFAPEACPTTAAL